MLRGMEIWKWNILHRHAYNTYATCQRLLVRLIERNGVIIFTVSDGNSICFNLFSRRRVFSTKFRDTFYKRAELCSVFICIYVRHSSNILVKVSRRSCAASRGAPRYVLHLRHIATVKFIPQEEKPFSLKYSISRHCEKLQRAYICVTNYINVTQK